MSRPERLPAHVDLRGFTYALAPFAQQQAWRMEKLRHALTSSQQQLAAALSHLQILQQGFQVQARHVQQGMLSHSDPTAHRRGLAYLAQLRTRMVAQEQELEKLQFQSKQLQAQCTAQQVRLDGLAEHRMQELESYAAELARRQAAEADRQWISRVAQRRQDTPTVEVETSL
jgi:hypothetical protein